jgi:hypothetical protein
VGQSIEPYRLLWSVTLSELVEDSKQEESRTALQWMKLQIADRARLMMDNQNTLNRTNRSDQQFRDFTAKQREHLAMKHGQIGEPMESEKPDEPMEIKIDSPTTVTHHHTAPPPPQTSTLAKLAMAGVAAAGLGSGIGIPLAVMSYMSNKPVPVAEAQPDTDTKYGLKIYRPSEAEEKP